MVLILDAVNILHRRSPGLPLVAAAVTAAVVAVAALSRVSNSAPPNDGPHEAPMPEAETRSCGPYPDTMSARAAVRTSPTFHCRREAFAAIRPCASRTQSSI